MSEEFSKNPKIVIILSGKRKCGKDYVANFLLERFGSEHAVIVRLSGPLKERYALENNLDYDKLLESSDYKELFREQMIKWGEEIRNDDPGYFCRHAIAQSGGESKRIWIVSDARRKTDVEFFLAQYPDATFTVRITASDSAREERGWKFTEGVDDAESECGLDDYNNWNFKVHNNNHEQMLHDIEEILQTVQNKC